MKRAMPLLHALRGAAPAGCNANLQIKKIRINKKKLSETAQLTVPGSFCVEMEFMRIQDGLRAKSQMQDVLICENGVGNIDRIDQFCDVIGCRLIVNFRALYGFCCLCFL